MKTLAEYRTDYYENNPMYSPIEFVVGYVIKYLMDNNLPEFRLCETDNIPKSMAGCFDQLESEVSSKLFKNTHIIQYVLTKYNIPYETKTEINYDRYNSMMIPGMYPNSYPGRPPKFQEERVLVIFIKLPFINEFRER